jgi:hypothetical protein
MHNTSWGFDNYIGFYLHLNVLSNQEKLTPDEIAICMRENVMMKVVCVLLTGSLNSCNVF